MADSLHEELTEIHGIGDAKADQILGIISGHDTEAAAGMGAGEVHNLLSEAEDYLEDDRPGYALKYMREARVGLEGD